MDPLDPPSRAATEAPVDATAPGFEPDSPARAAEALNEPIGSVARQAATTVPRAQFIAVDGRAAQNEVDASLRHSAERRAIDERLEDAGLRSTLAALPVWGATLALSCLPMAAAIGLNAPLAGLLWGLAMLLLAFLLWQLPRRTRHHNGKPGHAIESRRRIHALVGTAAFGIALAPWLGGPGAALALLGLLCTALAFAGVVCLGPLRLAALALALLPLSAGFAGAMMFNDMPHRALYGSAALAAAATLVAVVRLRHRAWRQNTRALIEQSVRLQALETERDAAWAADQDKSRFLAIASHDLRQPVHALGLFAATLQKRLQHTPDEPLARNMMRAIDGLERSFNAMLDISRLDAGALSPRVQTFPLRDMFRRLHMHYAGQAELSGLGLRFSPGGKSVTSDPQLLERIVGNLIQNAIKYTEHGGIVVLARSTSTHINIEIWDTGSGIAPDLLPRIFEEFYQVGRGERDRTHGLGMGLAIVKRLSSLLNHRLMVSSRPGHGTMFRIGVPIGELPGIQEDMAPADTVPMLLQSPQMVLIIDDEEPIREGLRLLLEEWGFQAMTAANAQQAEHAAAALEGHVDLILSDLHLGDGPDGLEAVANVRRLCGHDVAAVLVTGDTSHDEITRITASGLPVLFKPVQPKRLYEALRQTLG
ncbi:hybrid sensor histidine kinase/response regulator [Aquabacterium sp.]|uniref:hybrid sensor histidine kinase/response regulator n=1 Tax=Aquabacterium sp. TaxID=1872578 RepID=UPI002CA6DDEA|nr:ATP-binding protein [Aquabacterium sp.]HSW08709.1 ATP-binding protein [Aquabacterium sp.]